MDCASILRAMVLRARIATLATVWFGVTECVLAAAVPLNGPLVSGGDVTGDFQFSPDGSRVVFVANQEVVSTLEAWSVASGGGTAVPISGPFVAGGNVVEASGQFSPDGAYYFYLADQDTNEQFELYRTSTVGGSSARINGPLTSIGDVDKNFRISADGTRVTYVANAVTNDFAVVIYELFSVPSGGGDAVTLNSPLVVGGDVVQSTVLLSAGDRAYYVADQEVDNRFELYGVSSLGGEPAKLSVPVPPEGDVESEFWLTPDGTQVVYIAAEQTDIVSTPIFEIFSVPSTGGMSAKLNDALVIGGDVVAGSARISPDGGRVIYLADARSNDVVELFSAPTAGGADPERLNLPLPTNGDVSATGLQFAAGGERVVYGGDQFTDNVVELFSVPTLGGEPVRLNNDLQSSGDVDLASVSLSPDGSRVLFRADQNADEVYELYMAAVDGGPAVPLSGPLAPGGDVMLAGFSPDGEHVAYLADQETDNVFELFLVDLAGGMPAKISDPLTAGGDVTHWRFSPTGEYLVYRADQNADDVFELFSVALSVPEAPLTGDFNNDGIVDAADYTVWRNNLGAETEDVINHAGDGGGVDGGDYEMWKEHYGAGSAGTGGVSRPVPEPATLATCAALGLLLLNWNVRHRSRQVCLRRLVRAGLAA